ncbi:MAG TPA: ArsR family transcriptional regulator [Methanomassiliicoccaceae archaeon]|nr:ArsR family transcriptional regulator [Methanomassiliicoccaceae archaeon]
MVEAGFDHKAAKVLLSLADGEKTSAELQEDAKMTQSAVSITTSDLRERGLIVSRKDRQRRRGRSRLIYSLARPLTNIVQEAVAEELDRMFMKRGRLNKLIRDLHERGYD